MEPIEIAVIVEVRPAQQRTAAAGFDEFFSFLVEPQRAGHEINPAVVVDVDPRGSAIVGRQSHCRRDVLECLPACCQSGKCQNRDSKKGAGNGVHGDLLLADQVGVWLNVTLGMDGSRIAV